MLKSIPIPDARKAASWEQPPISTIIVCYTGSVNACLRVALHRLRKKYYLARMIEVVLSDTDELCVG